MSTRHGSGKPPSDGAPPGRRADAPEPLRVAIGDLAVVREEQVAALRARIERGEYVVPPELVARAFLRAMLADLLA
jgi:hypothetical protein